MNTSTKDWISTVMFRLLELSFVGGFLAILVLVITKEIPTNNHDIIISMLSVLGTCVVGIGGYEWGSSRGSEKKTDIIAASTPPDKSEEIKVIEAKTEQIKAEKLPDETIKTP